MTISPTLRTAGYALAGLLMASCATTAGDRPVAEICEAYCSERGEGVRDKGVVRLVKKMNLPGGFVDVPMRDIYLKTREGDLVTPYDVTYARTPESRGRLPLPDKRASLEPSCFSNTAYTPISLADVDLTTDNTTITFINFDKDGRVESRALDTSDPIFQDIQAILTTPASPGGKPEYERVQEILSLRARPEAASLDTMASQALSRRDLAAENVPDEKTPFYKDLTRTNYSDLEGHAFFYVLLDAQLNFARDVAALLTYAPEAEASLETLYAPFVQYPVTPSQPGQANANHPKQTRLDVLTFHFVRNVGMGDARADECRYIYDMNVISRGQEPFLSSTPLLIDPEVRSDGVIIRK